MKIAFSALRPYFLRFFDEVGACPVEALDREILYLEQWLKEGKHGQMFYLERYVEIRANPKLLLESARTAIVVLKNYYRKQKPAWFQDNAKVSNYAWGKDYHYVIRQQLETVLAELKTWIGNFAYRICIDSAPFMDKVWAKKAGLGWIGKNTNLIHPKKGSFFFIGTVLVDFEVERSTAVMKDYCGTCNRCIQACPTQALTPYELDARKCISYLTIELKEEIPTELEDKTAAWAYGCDICQEVCPWNRFSKDHQDPDLLPLDLGFLFKTEELEAMSNRQFQKKLERSAIRRVQRGKWLQNLLVSRRSRAGKPKF